MKLLFLSSLPFQLSLWLATTAHAQTVDYAKQIAPLLDAYCIDCHSADEADGDFALDDFAALMKGGEEGPAIVAGKSADSPLIKFLEGRSGRGGKNEFMPPGQRDKMKPDEIALIKTWIDAGAKGPVTSDAKPPIPRQVVTPKIMPTVPPKRAIQAVAFSSKVQLLAVGRYGPVELLNPTTRAVIRKLPGIKGKVNALLFSPDGEWLYAAGGEAGIVGEVRRWKVADGSAMHAYAGHLDACYAMALSPDGKLIATGAYDQRIKLWDAVSGKELATLRGHNGAVNGLAFRADGKVLASASADRTVKLWSIPEGARLDTLSQPTKEQSAVAFSADGTQLFAAGADNRIRGWRISANAAEGTNELVTSRYAHEGDILSLALSENGELLASSATDPSIKLWRAADLTEKLLLEKQPDWSPALAFGDKGRIVTGRVDGSLTIYDVANGKPVLPPKPEKPEVSRVAPRAVHSGGTTMVTITGKSFSADTAIKFSHPGLEGKIVPASIKPTTARVKITASADVPRGSHDIWLSNAGGESAKMKVFADDLPPTVTTAPSFKEGPFAVPGMPASLWGTLSEVGQHDRYRFSAKAGDEIVCDLAVAQIGSAAKSPVLEILDATGGVLAVNRGLDSGSDPFVAWKAPVDGDYHLVVSNTTMDGSPNHVYRLTVGMLPYVTGWFPLTAEAGTDVNVQLEGHHLGDNAEVVMKADKEGNIPVPVDTKAVRFRSMPAVRAGTLAAVVEKEDNDEVRTAQVVAAPVSVNARLGGSLGIPARDSTVPALESSRPDVDHFAFDAKAEQEWLIETFAAMAGSPADTKIEILDTNGEPVPRLLLQSVRDSYNNFRSVDANNPDIRLQNWEEMELNEYVYFSGDVMRILRMPRGPDSGALFYSTNGMRRAYFDTSANAHPLDELCYIVEPKPLGSQLVPNGLPVFALNYSNDDAGDRTIGRDSRLTFTAATDGRYIVRVTDTRGWSGERFVYSLSIREPKPDFSVKLAGANATVSPGSAVGFSFRAERRDGFDGAIQIDITGLPEGYHASTPLLIEAGHSLASGSLHAAPDAPAHADWTKVVITATATIGGKKVAREADNFGTVTLGKAPKFVIVMEPDNGGKPVMHNLADAAAPLEITLAPGQTTKAWLRAVRMNDEGLINLDVHGLPHGVIIEDIGLNGVQIREKENERPIFFRAAKWVKDQDKLCHAAISSARAEQDSARLQTSFPVLLKIRKTAAQVSSH